MTPGPQTKLFLSFSNRPGRFGASVYNELFKRRCIEAVYLPRGAPPEAAAIVDAIRALEVEGCSISAPHKAGVISFLDELEPEAREAGSVNTIVLRAGRLLGFSTDAAGIRGCLAGRQLRSVAIYGAGGVVGPAIVALRALGVERIVVFARRTASASAIASAFHVEAESGPSSERFDLLLNATPAGIEPPIPADLLELLSRCAGLLDLPVVPRPTALCELAAQRGLWVTPGVEMCIHQLARQASIYLGLSVPIDEIREIVQTGFIER